MRQVEGLWVNLKLQGVVCRMEGVLVRCLVCGERRRRKEAAVRRIEKVMLVRRRLGGRELSLGEEEEGRMRGVGKEFEAL